MRYKVLKIGLFHAVQQKVINLRQGELAFLGKKLFQPTCQHHKKITMLEIFKYSVHVLVSLMFSHFTIFCCERYICACKLSREFLKTQQCSKQNFYKLGPKICTPPPILGREKLSKPRLYHTVRVISKLFMNPTNIMASNPQVWLLALIYIYILILTRMLCQHV